ncbi:DNA polymerase III subunit gamma/tau [Vibrio sp. HA2012]|uniref:DNA polymerase III subunit gamma/tau n=1 Tax=Vibrio sp. HA2012 TaxID=1971595 RepID=UPI000C2CBF8F|nr:DNA polymerase III subunit gamma/tau [Vibrio sp. HA2012]PJC88222.1 DNA polymerase III subunit gamma/tau [Vibrio sp. HA2012]
MSYLALARKWRPTRFNQVVGQAHVLTALENALKQNKLHHAYLFSGTRGVGKTTIGRLFAKGLNCEAGITATPCGHCASCREIDEGRFVDLLEIDAASRTKVEDIRDLLDNVQYKPARGRFKVYLIDEVHMLSRHSFNALLKTLEEPPEHVKFLLATTDPQKLPVTILSRCLQFHLKPISVDTIHEQLQFILQQEVISAEPRALGMIAHAADGSMRDALSLTDQAIALSNGAIDTATVATMLGTLDADQAVHLLEAISGKQVQPAMACVHSLAQNGVEWDGLLQQLAAQLHRIAMYQALPSTLDKDKPDAEKIELLSHTLSPQDVQLFYQIALKGRKDLPLAPTERMGLEMVVLRMMAFRPQPVSAVNAITLPAQSPQPAVAEQMPPAAQAPLQETDAGYPPYTTEESIDMDPTTPMPPHPEEPDYAESEPLLVSPPPTDMPSVQVTDPDVKVTPRTGLRHQLRSRRNAASSASGTPKVTGSEGKKSDAAASEPSSVLDRIAQHSRADGMSHEQVTTGSAMETIVELTDSEPYRWQPSTVTDEADESAELKPSEIKQALEHTKTPEMQQKLVEESVALDPWSALIDQLSIPKLVEQLALNAAYHKHDSTIELVLRASHAHLNNDRAQGELLEALNRVLGEECHLTVQVGDSGQTPLELREALYQRKLAIALTSLESDTGVQFILKRFSAQLDRDSVRPV